MDREIESTNDGSKTLRVRSLDETYHSSHGALQEARHVFIKNGLNRLKNSEINILELGFGTGLNVLVTLDEFLKNNALKQINYFTIEKYPVQPDEINALQYGKIFGNKILEELNQKIHLAGWEKEVEILPDFFLTKIKADFNEIPGLELPPIDLMYYDCFGARVQPDLWEEDFVKKATVVIRTNGLLTTYSSKGSFRRALEAAGFHVEKLVGPPGKREMINAIKQ